MALTDTYKLNNGVEIPIIGFGTWQTPDGDVARIVILIQQQFTAMKLALVRG